MGKFAKDTLVTFGARLLQLLLGIGISVIIARTLGPEGKGVFSLAILLPALLVTFTNLGIGPASVYYVGTKKYSPKEIFGNNIIISFIIGIFAILVGLVIIFFFSDKIFPGVAKEYLLLALSLIPFQIFLLFVANILLGLQKIKKYNFIDVIQLFVFLILVAIFLLGFHFGIKGAIIAEITSVFGSCIILFFWTKKEAGSIFLKLNPLYLKDSFFYGIKSYLGNICSFLYFRIDMFLINFFLNPLAVGFYSIAVGIAERIWLISQSAAIVIFPRVSSEKDERKLKEFTPLVCRNILFITILLAVLLFLLSRWIIVFLYSEKFLDSILPFQILLIGAVTLGGSRILAHDLYGRGKPMLSTYTNFSALVLNIILNIFWIPKLGIVGAAWATSFSYTFALLMNLFFYSKISGNKIIDILLVRKSDFRLYKDFLAALKNRRKGNI